MKYSEWWYLKEEFTNTSRCRNSSKACHVIQDDDDRDEGGDDDKVNDEDGDYQCLVCQSGSKDRRRPG